MQHQGLTGVSGRAGFKSRNRPGAGALFLASSSFLRTLAAEDQEIGRGGERPVEARQAAPSCGQSRACGVQLGVRPSGHPG